MPLGAQNPGGGRGAKQPTVYLAPAIETMAIGSVRMQHTTGQMPHTMTEIAGSAHNNALLPVSTLA